jgi:hypothetical protein
MKEASMHFRNAIARACFCAAALMTAMPAPAQSFRAYLSSTGNDANPCSLQQPCRLLPAALAAVADGGEIWMLDSANYNTSTVSITKSVTILAIPGAIGSVVATGGGSAVDINTPGVKVTLRNLVIVHLTSSNHGVSFTQGAQLGISGCEISGIQGAAVYASASGGKVSVRNSVLRGSGGTSVGVRTLGDVNATLDAVQVKSFLQGIYADAGGRVTVSDSVLAGNVTGAIAISSGGADTRFVIAHSAVSGNAEGLRGQTTTMLDSVSLTARSNSISHNTTAGIRLSHAASSSLVVALDANTIAENNVGVEVIAGTPSVRTRENNAMRFNTPDVSGTSLTPLSAQ